MGRGKAAVVVDESGAFPVYERAVEDCVERMAVKRWGVAERDVET